MVSFEIKLPWSQLIFSVSVTEVVKDVTVFRNSLKL